MAFLAAGNMMMIMGCTTMTTLKTVPNVNLDRFMGDWYVIANIPTFIEKNAYSAVESYRMDSDGTIATTFTFHEGSFDGPVKTYHPRGFIRDRKSNAVWDMQFIWPIKAEYLIIYLNDDYTLTVIGRSKLDYLWIMSRSTVMSDSDYQGIITFLAGVGYDTSKIQRVPQRGD